MEQPSKFLTVEEVADLLRLNPQTVYRMAREGRLPAFKVGNRWRFDRQRVTAWLSEQEAAGHGDAGPGSLE